MHKKVCWVLASFLLLGLVCGCATLTYKEKTEAADWLHAGDLAYEMGDYERARYFYELVRKKYPNTQYSRTAASKMIDIRAQEGILGKSVRKGVDFVDPLF